ncbi:phage protein [Pseudomonas phage PA01]|uniref:Phage protein n=1 Tax=Pseudomonas phage PA01 TaxID=2498591 RepID=A0A455W6Q6_9CAUD|nr:phage protein [Pseudomonas phage PA01]BBI98244.1 phage protein [Pseudomonas phage PA01]
MNFPSDKVMLRIVQSILAILIGIAWACADYGVVAAELPPSLQAHPARPGHSEVSARDPRLVEAEKAREEALEYVQSPRPEVIEAKARLAAEATEMQGIAKLISGISLAFAFFSLLFIVLFFAALSRP